MTVVERGRSVSRGVGTGETGVRSMGRSQKDDERRHKLGVLPVCPECG